jgi:hypothetical protein
MVSFQPPRSAADLRKLVPESPPAWADEVTEAGPLVAQPGAAPAPQQLALFLPEDLAPAPARPTRLPRRIKALLTAIDAQRKGLGQAGAPDPQAPASREPARPRPTLWPDSFFNE